MPLHPKHPGSPLPRGTVAGSAVQIGARVIALFLGLALMATLTRHLGVAEYGLYSVAVVVSGWLSMTLAVTTVGTTVRIVAGEEHGHRYAATMLQLVALVGTGFSLCLFLASGWLAAALHSHAVAPLLRILAPDLALAGVAAIYSGILVGREQFLASAGVLTLGAATQLAAAWLLVGAGWQAAGGCAAVLAGSAVQVLVGWRLTGIGLWPRERVPFAHLWRSVRLLALGQLALRISQSMDLLAVKSLLRSPVAAGHYAGAQNISIAAMGLFAPAAGVVLQALSSARREGDAARLQATASRFVRTALAYAALLCALSVAAPRITSFLLGPDFAPSAQILALLLWAVAFRILAATGRVLISAVNESTSILLPLLALILIGLAAYALIVPAAGLSGAAWVATGLAAAAGATSLREGLRLTGIAFPWLSALRIFTSALASAAVASVDLGGGVLVLPVLAAATATFLALLALLGEWGHPRRWLAIPWRSGSP